MCFHFTSFINILKVGGKVVGKWGKWVTWGKIKGKFKNFQKQKLLKGKIFKFLKTFRIFSSLQGFILETNLIVLESLKDQVVTFCLKYLIFFSRIFFIRIIFYLNFFKNFFIRIFFTRIFFIRIFFIRIFFIRIFCINNNIVRNLFL